jgi:hypothetical protein
VSLDQAPYYALLYYTLSHPDPAFIHQNAVDAYAAQHAEENSKPIAVAFALIGLYLYVEKGFSGRQVQQRHMQLAKRRKQWPAFALPPQRGTVTISDVLAAPAGEKRDQMIREWCFSVWSAWSDARDRVIELLESEPNLV